MGHRTWWVCEHALIFPNTSAAAGLVSMFSERRVLGRLKAASGLSFLLGTGLVMLRKGRGLARETTIVFLMAVKSAAHRTVGRETKDLGES